MKVVLESKWWLKNLSMMLMFWGNLSFDCI